MRLSPPSRHQSWLPAAVALVAALPFLPALGAGFLAWDDNYFLTGNELFRGFGPARLRWMFTSAIMGIYQPVAWMSYAVDFTLWGMDSRGFHLTNIALHAANAALFWGLAARLLEDAVPEEDAKRIGLAAACAALLFAVHPLRVEDAAWASERRDLLCAFFYIAGLRFYVDGRRAACWAAFVLALFSKGMAVTFPAALMILDWSRGKKIRWPATIGFFAAAAAMGAWTLWLLRTQGRGMKTLAQHGLVERLLHAAYSLGFYAWKTVWPFHLSPVYTLPESYFEPRFLLCAVAVAGLGAWLAWKRREHRAWAAGMALYAVVLAPVSGLLHGGSQLVADRYSYLACLPFPLLAAAGLLRLGRRRPQAWQAGLAAMGLAIFFLGGLSLQQTRIWRDDLSFWSYAVQAEPLSAVAHNNLGAVLSPKDPAAAAVHFQEALNLDPDCVPAQDRLAEIWGKPEALDEARLLAQIINEHPECRNARFNLMTARAALGENEAPAAYFRMIARQEPENLRARAHLERVLKRTGKRYNTVDAGH